MKRALLVWHRRAGKEIVCWNWCIKQAFWHRVGTYVYFFPTASLGKRILWEGCDKNGRRFLDYIPKDIIDGDINNSEMKLRLKNGSLIQVIGTDKTINVGVNPIGCIFSEYALQDPKCWNFVRPILRENGGWSIFNSTPRGKNHMYDLYLMAKHNPDWFCQLLSVDDTKVLKPRDIESERAEGMSEDLIQQEYYCSFDQGSEGSYYAKLLNRMELDGRICFVPYDPTVSVDTYWDIGVADPTVILFVQNIGNEIRIINMYTNRNVGLDHYARILQQYAEKFEYVYGTHWGPHDIANKEFGSGARTRIQIASDLGIKFKIVPNISVADGIELARGIFPRIWVDSEKCKFLLKCLDNYHAKFNSTMNVYSEIPVHDWSSHCMDAFRYMAVCQNNRSRSYMTENDAKTLEERYSFRHC